MTMNAEDTFLSDIIANLNDDAPRLIFADWLEDHNQLERAELIRLQCQLAPDEDRYDDPQINAIRDRVEELLQPIQTKEAPLFSDEIRIKWRRGFVDSLELTAQHFIRNGEQLRKRYPTLRKLVLFRLNGWGQQLAACKWLEGISEIELPCWYSSEDAEAIANSPHMNNCRRLVCWAEEDTFLQAINLHKAKTWPQIQNLHLVTDDPSEANGWTDWFNMGETPTIATICDINTKLFSFAPDFHPDFYVGRLPNQSMVFLQSKIWLLGAYGLYFDVEGMPQPEMIEVEFPEYLACMDPKKEPSQELKREFRQKRIAYLKESIGFTPAFIRVHAFSLGDNEFSVNWNRGQNSWRTEDPHPTESDGEFEFPLGHGGQVYDWVTQDCFLVLEQTPYEDWVFDRSGHIIYSIR